MDLWKAIYIREGFVGFWARSFVFCSVFVEGSISFTYKYIV